MKKIVSIILVALMLLSATTLVSCNNKPLQIGLGVYTEAKATDATEDVNGKGEVTATVAAVLLDANGKIVQCVIDCADYSAEITASGEARPISNNNLKTKRDQGADYGMVKYAGATKEWFEQAEAFATLCVGKTADEVKALVVNSDKGTDEVINAGCTITVNEMALAVEKAVKSAKESGATASDTLKLGVFTAYDSDNATEDAMGKQELEISFAAVAVGNNKITAAYTDCLQATFKFDNKGDASDVGALKTKREQGADYGMVKYGGATKEWFEQADVLDTAVVGKQIDSVGSLLGKDGYGNEDIQSAGCTILVNDCLKAIANAY